MEQRILGDKKRARYDEGLVDIVNKKYAKEAMSSEEKTSDTEQTEEEIQKEIHKTLAMILDNYEIHSEVKSYGHPVKFAEGRADDRYFTGYSHLEIDPSEGYLIVIRTLEFMADRGDQTYDAKYKLYKRDGEVFFKRQKDDEIDAAKTLRHLGVFSSNVDRSKVQTAESIRASLYAALPG